MILGLTGSYCSGKDTVAEYLTNELGFQHRSLSDELRKYLSQQNIEPTRDNLIKNGKMLREKEGNGILARLALKTLDRSRKFIITSIRHPSEIEELKKHGNFFLINVDAPAKIRFERMKTRNRPGDPKTFEEFLACEQNESQTEGSGQQLTNCAKLADHTLINDAQSIELLKKKVDELIKTLK